MNRPGEPSHFVYLPAGSQIPGQAPRVPPNLNPTAQQQQLASQFRTGVYAPYGMPQSQQQQQQQRAPAQAAYPQPARTAYALPTRSFPFSGVQQQAATAAQQSHLHALMPQPNGSSGTPAPNGTNTPDTSTSLDPNEFPALGTSAPQPPPFSYAAAGASGGAGYAPPGGNYAQSGNYAAAGGGNYSAGTQATGNYASAGAGGNYAAAGASGGNGSFVGAGSNGQGQSQQQRVQRELTQDDFPALGQGEGGFASSAVCYSSAMCSVTHDNVHS